MRVNLDRLLAPWVFVLTGIIFNILSALITHYFIGLNNEAINAIDRDINDKQVLIDSQWQSRVEVERKEEFFILLFAQQNANPEISDAVYRDYLEETIATYDLTEFEPRMDRDRGNRLGLLLDVSAAALETIIETINETYFEILELREAKIPLENENSRLLSIAIFLQVIGLILVLSRDLRRR